MHTCVSRKRSVSLRIFKWFEYAKVDEFIYIKLFSPNSFLGDKHILKLPLKSLKKIMK
jgi:hypothetical protein